jgi:hypothetical protein
MIDRYEILETNSVRLSMAIYLQDAFSKIEPIGLVNVSMRGSSKKPIKNASFYYLFLNLPDGDYTFDIKSDYYFDETYTYTVTQIFRDPLSISLLPKPSYPFPPGETLVRGVLMDPDNPENPMPNAELSWKDGKVLSRTTELGEFVIYFGGLTEDDIKEDPITGKKFVVGDVGTTLNIKVIYNGATSILTISDVEFGKTNSLNKP